MIERLPAEIIMKVLSYSTVPERLNLATCTTELLERITTECPGLWNCIDFYPYHERFNKGSQLLWRQTNCLTDRMLSALLQRVHARDVTTILRLKGCTNIVGHGLEPLRGSRVLAIMDLSIWPGGAPEGKKMNETLVIDIMQTMLPHKLSEVHFQSTGMRYSETRNGFNQVLHATKQQRALA